MQKTAGPEKFSFYLISRIDGVKTRKNWFLSKSLEFEASVWSLCFFVSLFLCFFVSWSLCFDVSLFLWFCSFLCTLVSLFRCFFLSIFHVSVFLCFCIPMFLCTLLSFFRCFFVSVPMFLCFFVSFFLFFKFSEGPHQSLLVSYTFPIVKRPKTRRLFSIFVCNNSSWNLF